MVVFWSFLLFSHKYIPHPFRALAILYPRHPSIYLSALNLTFYPSIYLSIYLSPSGPCPLYKTKSEDRGTMCRLSTGVPRRQPPVRPTRRGRAGPPWPPTHWPEGRARPPWPPTNWPGSALPCRVRVDHRAGPPSRQYRTGEVTRGSLSKWPTAH